MAFKVTKTVWLVFGLCLAALLFTVYIYSTGSRGITVKTAVAMEKTIQAYIDEHGRSSLPHVYHITMPMQGRILPMEVSEGDEVVQGQSVANIEDLDWRDAALEVESITTTFENWLEASGAQLRAAEIRQEFEKWNWERNKSLAERSAISEREQRDSKRNYLDSNVKLESSEAMYFATKAFQSIIDLMPGYVQRNFDRTKIKSPVAGTILKRHVWNEKMMNAGAPLLDIGNLDELEVTADILTEEAVHIHPGDRVEFYGDSLGDHRLNGVVRIIEPEAFTKTSSLGVEEQRVTVKMSFTEEARMLITETNLNLGLHYRVRCKIITDENPNATTIPRTALFVGANGKWQLYKVEHDKAVLTPVDIGLINPTEAEVIKGLQPDDTIVSIPQSDLADGIKVNAL